MKLAIFFSLKQTNKKQQQQSIIPPPSQHITPGQRLFFSSFTPHKTHNVELYEFHSYLRPLMPLRSPTARPLRRRPAWPKLRY